MKMKEIGPRGGARPPTSPSIRKWYGFQWRIQDFPEGGTNPWGGGGHKLLFDQFSRKLHENKFWPSGARVPGAPFPISTNGFSAQEKWNKGHEKKA